MFLVVESSRKKHKMLILKHSLNFFLPREVLGILGQTPYVRTLEIDDVTLQSGSTKESLSLVKVGQEEVLSLSPPKNRETNKQDIRAH